MKRVLFAISAVLLLTIPAAAQPTSPQYPEDAAALPMQWIAAMDAKLAPHENAAWRPDLEDFLSKARTEAAEGRLRSVAFDLETINELMLAGLIMEEANMTATSNATKKSVVLQKTQALRAEAQDAWLDFRARLHELDGEVRSLQTLEYALYAADTAIAAKVNLDTYDRISREYPKAPGFERTAILDLLRASATPRLEIGYASDILELAFQKEGLPPELKASAWGNYTRAELARQRDDGGGRLAQWEDIAEPVRANGEGILAAAISLAEQRVIRHQAISLTYGDAQSRGINTTRDAGINMWKRLNRTSMEDVQAYGLTGIITADAADQAIFILDFFQNGRAQVQYITAVWANLDHQELVAVLLAAMSPVKPAEKNNLGEQNNLTRYMTPSSPPPKDGAKGTPALGGLAILGSIAFVAIALRRRR